MTLRDAAQSDAPVLLRLMHAAFEEYRAMLDPPSGVHGETLDTVREKLKAGYAVLALIEEQPVGCAFVRSELSHVYFSRLSVLPDHRRRGIGGALIEHVERNARADGVKRVRLGVRIALPHLKARYEKLGYSVVEFVTHEGYNQPTYVLMEKQVL